MKVPTAKRRSRRQYSSPIRPPMTRRAMSLPARKSGAEAPSQTKSRPPRKPPTSPPIAPRAAFLADFARTPSLTPMAMPTMAQPAALARMKPGSRVCEEPCMSDSPERKRMAWAAKPPSMPPTIPAATPDRAPERALRGEAPRSPSVEPKKAPIAEPATTPTITL